MSKTITRPAVVPEIDPDDAQAAVEAAPHRARVERDSGVILKRAARMEQPRPRVMVQFSPDMMLELDRRAGERGWSRSMFILEMMKETFQRLNDEEAAEAEARAQWERDKAAAAARKLQRSAAAKKAAKTRARAK